MYALLHLLFHMLILSNAPAPPEIYTLSLHDALPILVDDTIATYSSKGPTGFDQIVKPDLVAPGNRSEEHTSELQSLRHLVCRLLLEKKKKKISLTQKNRLDKKAITAQETSELFGERL